jgi:hypothetical protein
MAQTTLTTTETLMAFDPIMKKSLEPLIKDAETDEKKCSFCLCTSTPMWRRGPNGKSTLCNACGVKWSIRNRNPKQSNMRIEQPEVMLEKQQQLAETKPKKRGRKPKSAKPGERRDVYYCRYCHMTWPVTAFKNRQQFGAHCSNCSRKRKSRGTQHNINYLSGSCALCGIAV